MRYKSGFAFRRALEDRLRKQSFQSGTPAQSTIDDFGGTRYQLQSFLDGRTFENFQLDVGVGDPLVDPVEYLQTTNLLAFAGFPPTVVPCYPVTQQIAEKQHACTRTFQSGASTRIKDYLDILLLAGMGAIDCRRLQEAIRSTFLVRDTHPVPPKGWERPFQRTASEIQLEYTSLEEANTAMEKFLNPILGNETIGIWDPLRRAWE
ncbi:nucleotidyl transferase AbiEii/AbiGii toxin family protein [Candidatus Leptofilum sp.]|uniref:nucleotidyl transferase AbiEii/AbiGii toxin family protein n=1 Tax=Candidatus Leptofilum sp. TaxID=3241576 RepID=UPI003B58CC40